MAHENGAVNGALEAISGCMRQQIHRPVQDLSYELGSHVKVYLDQKHYEQGYIFLNSLLTSGISISKPATPYAGLLAPPPQLALASTLLVYPQVTTKSTSNDALRGSNAALRYLRSVHDTVRGPGYKTIKTAFAFFESRRRGVRSPLDTPSPTLGSGFERIDVAAANAHSLWSRGEDFWHVVGWAFNCAVIHKKRWARWQLWLELMLDFLENEWEDCMNNSISESPEREELAQESLIWQYISSQDPSVSSTRRRIVKAILANADQQSLQQYPEVFYEETAEPKLEDAKKKTKGIGQVDFEKGDMGDYGSDDEDVVMGDAPQTSGRARRSKNANPRDLSLPSLDEALIPDYQAAVDRLGGIDAVTLRQRFVSLLSKVSQELPRHFTNLEGVFDSFTKEIMYFPAHVLNVLITTSPLPPRHQLAFNVNTLVTFTSQKYPDFLRSMPVQKDLEELFTYRARTQGFSGNAKVSLILERVFMYMMGHKPSGFKFRKSLMKVVDAGIKERCSARGMKNKADDELCEQILEASSERLRGLLEVLEMATG